MKRRCLLSFILVFWFCTMSIAQKEPYRPLRITSAMDLDGKLDELVWQQAPMSDDFMQADPIAGAAPSERTEFRMVYNDDFLFIGLRCYDAEPDKLIKLNFSRDFEIGQEDGVAFIIDTYNDKSSGLGFITNLLGARWDEEFTSDAGNENPDYNTYWDTKSYIDSLGYTTELRIPFSSLRFELKEDAVRMGFRFVRLIKRKNEFMIYPKNDPKIGNPYFKVSLAQEMEFNNLKSKKPFYITPYVIANYFESYDLNVDGTAYQKNSEFMTRKHYADNESLDKIISNMGVDVKYGLTKNATLDFTLNTDFSQAEVDNVIINLSKYEVNLPEKRSFFLESKNYLGFATANGTELFVSRTIGNENDLIVPIITGVRVTGKSNGWQAGVLDMQTKGISTDSIDPHNYFVFRTRKDIDSTGSFVGGIITNRINTSGINLSNQTFGLDAVKKLNDHLTLVGAVSSTFIDFDMNSFSKSTYYNASVFRTANTGFTYNSNVDFVGEEFDPVMGYSSENDYGAVNAGMGYKMAAPESGRASFYYVNNFNAYRWKLKSGDPETFYSDLWPGVSFKNGSEINFSLFEYKIDSLFEDWELDINNSISAGTYRMFNNSINLVAPQNSVYNAGIEGSYGGFYGGDRIFLSPNVSVYLGRHFNVGVVYEYNHIQFDKYLDVEKSTLFESNLFRLNIIYAMSTRFSIKLFTQYEDLNHTITGNLRFRYNPREGTDLYVVFNTGRNTNRDRLDPKLPVTEQRAITIKFLRTFAL